MPARCPGGDIPSPAVESDAASQASPPSAQARADRHATVTSESCDVKDVPAGRHFRRWGQGGAARSKPRPRLVLRGQLCLQRREVLSSVGQSDGTGQDRTGRDGEGACGQHAGRGSRDSRRAEVCMRLSVVGSLAQSVGAI